MLPGPSRLASVRAAGDEPAVRLGPLGRPIPGRVPPRASPDFVKELEAFFDQRQAVCAEAPATLAATGDSRLTPLVEFWQSRQRQLRDLFHAIDCDIVGAFRRLQDAGHLEIISSAATH